MDPDYSGLYVLREGRPLAVPDGFTLLSPGKLWPMLKSPLFSTGGKLRMMLEPFIRPRRESTDESLASFARRRVGAEVFDRLIQPLIGGIYTSDPDKLSMQATMSRFVDMERQFGSLARGVRRASKAPQANEEKTVGVRYGLFASLRDGMSRLLDELERRVRARAKIQTHATVVHVQRSSDGSCWEIGLEDSTHLEADAVIVATASYRAATMLTAALPQLASKLDQIEFASSAIVASGHRLADIAHPLDAYGLVIPHQEGRQILAVSFTSRKYSGRAPEGRVILRTFVGGALQPEMMQLSDDEILTVVNTELEQILGVRGSADWMRVFRYTRAMPQYHVGHSDRVDAIEREVQALNGLELAGNAYRGVGVPDVIHSGEEAAERVWDSVTSSEAVETVDH